jgi:hypothetical protein
LERRLPERGELRDGIGRRGRIGDGGGGRVGGGGEGRKKKREIRKKTARKWASPQFRVAVFPFPLLDFC